ncbi:MAG: DUF3054 domain-containing protein [Chloroflexota bacterium]
MKSKQFVLIAGDLIALLLFVFIGQIQHGLLDDANPLLNVLNTAWIFALVWLIVGWFVGAFPSDEMAFTRRNLIDKSLNAWLITTLIGVVIRAFWIDSAVIFRSFAIATVVFGLLFLWAWRIPFLLWQRRVVGRAESSQLESARA